MTQQNHIKSINTVLFVVNAVLLIMISAVLIFVIGERPTNISIGISVICVVLVISLFFRKNANINLLMFSINISFGMVFLCLYNILSIERLFNFQINNRLKTDCALRRKLNDKVLKRRETYVSYGSDRLFYRRKPGSMHYSSRQITGTDRTVDYNVKVDETGYLNLNRGFYDDNKKIDIFVAGDSVLQGAAMPSVFSKFKNNLSIWNLSTGSYSPRQKVTALLNFALNKHPKWLVLEFYSGNDNSEIIENNACKNNKQKFICLFCTGEIAKLLCQEESHIESDCCDKINMLTFRQKVVKKYLLLAVLRYYWDIWKPVSMTNNDMSTIEVIANKACGPCSMISDDKGMNYVSPSYAHFAIDPNERMAWVKKGMDITLREYDRLREKISADTKVLLLYNPCGYEIYHDIIPPDKIDSITDEISIYQRATLKKYSQKHGFMFYDLTEDFQERVNNIGYENIFSDFIHWNELGTEIAFEILKDVFKDSGIVGARLATEK
ncbi:MAG: hypothetical protein FVQ80_00575 [Planctomycetes bacterium]|nr:hypothetical protein [Planctomycetota bacterium]